MMAYFDSTRTLQRFDALGGATALFFLTENDALATVNKVESKMLYALFDKGNLDKIYYFDNAKNDAYPIVQLPKDERYMKGFRWDPERKPRGPQDITPFVPRTSQRTSYLARPHAEFKETNVYFPGHINKIYKDIAYRDSMAVVKARQPKETPVVTAPVDTTAAPVDTTIAPADTTVTPVDTTEAPIDTTAAPAALSAADDSLRVALDSLSAATVPEKPEEEAPVVSAPKEEKADQPAVKPKKDEEPKKDDATVAEKAKEAEKARKAEEKRLKDEEKARIAAEKQAAKEAKWAEEDKKFQEKQAAKEQKRLEKERKAKLRALKKLEKKAAKERRIFERYLEKERKRAEKAAAREAEKARKQAEKARKEAEKEAIPEQEPQSPDKSKNARKSN